MSETPGRYIRIPNALWDKATKKSKRMRTNVSEVIRDLLERWVSEDDESSVEEIVDRLVHDLNDLQRRLKRYQ